jgi:hypothetical protein
MYASSSDHNHVSLSGGVLTLKATRISSGWSGSPGPAAETVYRARNVYIGRTRA